MRRRYSFAGADALVRTSVVLISAAATSCGSAGAPVLLFNGTGVSRNDVAALEAILKNNRLRYSEATSAQLNRMDQAQIRRYRLLIVPGGNFVEIGKSLTPDATANIRKAVHDGLNYLGICAGGFLAVFRLIRVYGLARG